jgi:hypothetical protein
MRELIISTILDALTHSATITAVPGRRARRFVSQLDGLTPRRDHVLDTPVAARYVADNEKVAIRGTAFAIVGRTSPSSTGCTRCWS